MTPEQFVYWLQGYFELSDDTDRLTKREHIIRDHLKEVFEKKTPDRGSVNNPDPEELEHNPLGTGETGTPWTNPNEFIC